MRGDNMDGNKPKEEAITLDEALDEVHKIEWQDLNLQFNGYPITNPLVTQKAQTLLKWMNEENRVENHYD